MFLRYVLGIRNPDVLLHAFLHLLFTIRHLVFLFEPLSISYKRFSTCRNATTEVRISEMLCDKSVTSVFITKESRVERINWSANEPLLSGIVR